MQVLGSEQDLSTKRNAFQMLCQHAQPLAVKYLLSQVDSVALWGDILQIAALDLIAKVRLIAQGHFGCSYASDFVALVRLSQASVAQPDSHTFIFSSLPSRSQ